MTLASALRSKMLYVTCALLIKFQLWSWVNAADEDQPVSRPKAFQTNSVLSEKSNSMIRSRLEQGAALPERHMAAQQPVTFCPR